MSKFDHSQVNPVNGLHPTLNAFEACVPRSTAPDSHEAPKKRGPKKHSLTPEQRNAAVTAYKPSAHSHNYAAAPTQSKPVTTASRRFATA